MAKEVRFDGIVTRVEPDGFGVVKFDALVGSNTHGIFSPSTSNADLPFGLLKPGMHVTGTAHIGTEDLAAVRSVEIAIGGSQTRSQHLAATGSARSE